MLNWFKNLFRKKPTVLDGNEIYPSYDMFITHKGKIIIANDNISATVIGVTTWPDEVKR